jgi:hypothetical protein
MIESVPRMPNLVCQYTLRAVIVILRGIDIKLAMTTTLVVGGSHAQSRYG